MKSNKLNNILAEQAACVEFFIEANEQANPIQFYMDELELTTVQACKRYYFYRNMLLNAHVDSNKELGAIGS